MPEFKDNFSVQSEFYKKYRPDYPKELYDYLSSLCPKHDLVWDCATGNGQAAIMLAQYFKKVIATEPSEEQIKKAEQKSNIEYRVEKAEMSSLADESADLITIAQALHWFDFEKFYAEVDRVLKPAGICAAWCYGVGKVHDPFDKALQDFHDNTVGKYWAPEAKFIDDNYRDIPFPLANVSRKRFTIQKELSFEDLKGLLNSWSAVQNFIKENNANPVEIEEINLGAAWNDLSKPKIFNWDVVVLTGVKG